MEEPYHPFKSQEAKETYLAYYDEHAKRWPIASEEKMVKTSFGQTFVRISGPEDGAPLVLLPGDSENSLAFSCLDTSNRGIVEGSSNIRGR
jgi:hypothetical protein